VYRGRNYSNQLYSEDIKFRSILYFTITGMIMIFILIALITSFDFKYRLSSFSIKESVSYLSTESIVHFMGTENPYFTQTLPKDYQPTPISTLAFELATSITPGDIRSLLGRELPGFAVFDTDIIVAGEGTNFTNLPMESAPPMEVLMQEREIVEENLNVGQETEDRTKPPAKTTNGKKVMYIYQSHSYESFLPLLKGAETTDQANSSNPKANMIAVGAKLAEELEKRGIGVQHDTTNMGEKLLDRGWQHPQAYKLSKEIVQTAMANNGDLKYIFDLHRDSQRKKVTTATINGKSFARVFFVVGQEHKDYEKNMEVAKKLDQQLNAKYPGISRGIFPKNNSTGNGVYNQDLSNNAVLVEIGGVDNTMEELYRTTEALAEVISDYYWQAEKVNAES
jgi:stage II sporulation protein P